MTPDRVAAILRELLQTPKHELGGFARRHGLTGDPTPRDLERAQEIVRALAAALQSGPGPYWERISDAWTALVGKHGPVDLSALGPAPPPWVRHLPPKPSLGDPAPGTASHGAQQQKRERFVPVAAPAHVPPQPQAQPRAQPRTQPQPRTARTEPLPAAGTDIQESVAKYAAFCAACAAHPERIATTQLEYGIANDFHRVNIDTLWQDRFDEDPELHRQWERLFAQFRDSLRRGKG